MKTADRHPAAPCGAQGGFVLVGALLIMLVLVLIGISATTSTNLELQIATVERTHRETFYNADAGLEFATALLEENVSCPEGFSSPATGADRLIGPIRVFEDALAFWQNPRLDDNAVMLAFLDDPASQADLTMGELYPWINPNPERSTNIRLGGRTVVSPGAALQMAAGYVGLGKAAASGGTALLYDIYAQHLGLQNSESVLHIQWRHVVGQEGPCRDLEL
jgi:hypothetical protein